MASQDKISGFQGEYRWMSNFWLTPVLYQGGVYPSVEHIYQALKSPEPFVRSLVLACETPGEAKRFLKKHGLPVRSDWDEVKVGIMTELVRSKFFHSEELGNKLIQTGDRLIEEGNSWGDVFWGVCKGEGQNWMGRILMQVRSELCEERERDQEKNGQMWDEILGEIE